MNLQSLITGCSFDRDGSSDDRRTGARPAVGRSRHRGSALIMGIVISVVISAMVMVIAWTSTTMVQGTGSLMHQIRAQYVAEGAAQRAYWRFRKDQTFRANPSGSPVTAAITGSDTVDGLTYSYTVTVVGATNAPVLVTSTATYGSVQGQVHTTLTAGSGTPAAIVDESGGNIQFSQTATVTGNLYGGGSISFHTGDTVTGNVTSTSTISGGTISGTTTPNAASVTVPTVATIYSSIQPTAHAISSGNISSLDFSTYPILFANGNVTLQSGLTVIGHGTLIVNGDLSLNADIGSAGSPQTFSLVVAHDFNPSKNVYLTGSVYIEHDFNCSGTVVITGAIVDNHNVSFSQTATLTYATPPSFDPRGGSLTQTNYGGSSP